MADTPDTPARRQGQRQGQGQKPRRRGFGLQAIAKTLPKVTAQVLGRRGFAEADLLSNWAAIVGPELAARCTVRKLERPRRGAGGEGVLTLRVEAGFALELQHLEPQLLERINSHFGYRAVGRLRLLQAPAPAPEAPRRPDPPADPAEQAALEARLAAVEDSELKAALGRFGRAVLHRGD